jgi:quercetin dioxygenase-like cupin family protein
MERIPFGADVALSLQDGRLQDVTLAPLTGPLSEGGPVQAAVFRIAAGGVIARHPAVVAQILAVVEGAGEVSGADGVREPISAGEAVYWSAGEEHETRSATGLTAVIVEAPGLAPYRRAGRSHPPSSS